MLVVLLVLFLLSLRSVGDACSDHVGWFRLYKPVVVLMLRLNTTSNFYKPVVVLVLRLNTTAKDNDEDDQYSRYFFSMFMLWLF